LKALRGYGKRFSSPYNLCFGKIAGYDKKIAGTDETEAKIIAYASQYVDDNCDRAYTIREVDVKLLISYL